MWHALCAVHNREYIIVQSRISIGETAATIMASEGSVVTSEPKSRRKEIEDFVRDLDPLQVSGTSV